MLPKRRYPTEEEIRLNFDRALNEAVTQGIYQTELGLDRYTDKALLEVANSFPNITDELIAKAKQELEFQFDGTHRERAALELAADLGEPVENS